MKDIRVTITNAVPILNEIKEGLGDLMFNTLKEKQKNHRLGEIFEKYIPDWPSFSDSEYRLSTLIYYGTSMNDEFKEIYDRLKPLQNQAK